VHYEIFGVVVFRGRGATATSTYVVSEVLHQPCGNVWHRGASSVSSTASSFLAALLTVTTCVPAPCGRSRSSKRYVTSSARRVGLGSCNGFQILAEAAASRCSRAQRCLQYRCQSTLVVEMSIRLSRGASERARSLDRDAESPRRKGSITRAEGDNPAG